MALTLEDPATGEAQEFEVTPNGKDCEEKPKGKPAKAESKPKAESNPAPAAKKAGQYAPHKSEAAANDGGKQKPAPRKPPRRKASSLDWSPCVDHDYKGFKARSGAGQFKLLHAKNTQWALFYELAGSKARKVGCFGKEMEAKVKAQALHDAGWPASETPGGVTADDLKGACPAPSRKDEAKAETKKEAKVEHKAPKDKTETAPAATPAPTPDPSKADAQKDQELMSSFTSELNNVLDEDEGDD